MIRTHGPLRTSIVVGWLSLLLLTAGCTSLQEYVHNGFKVGPNYRRPPAPLAPEWIDAQNPHVHSMCSAHYAWWRGFNDPVLEDLVLIAYHRNINLRIAGTRVLEARAQRAIAVGTLFPQSQAAVGAHDHVQLSRTVANPAPRPFFDNWATSFNVSWEFDFWGKFRRTIESADAVAEASVDDFDNVMVTLIADLAAAYVQYRIFEQQLIYTQENVRLQSGSLQIATDRWKAGQDNELGVVQASSLLNQLESVIPVLEIGLRQANNQLCVLLGIPPTELAELLGKAPIPDAPAEVAVGIPADLLRRRPDLRAAEQAVAAQSAQIGVAETDLYPAFFLNGSFGYQAKDFSKLIGPNSFTGSVGPGFQWNILNYGRIVNNVRFQDYKTQELVGVYQQKVLTAAREVEDGIVAFLGFRQQADDLAASVEAAERGVRLVTAQYTAGVTDYTPVFVAQQFLAQQQNVFAQAQGDISLGLIGVYRALGGGWELRLDEHTACGEAVFEVVVPPGDEIPLTIPEPQLDVDVLLELDNASTATTLASPPVLSTGKVGSSEPTSTPPL